MAEGARIADREMKGRESKSRGEMMGLATCFL